MININRILSRIIVVVLVAVTVLTFEEYNKKYAKVSDVDLKGILIVIDPGHGGIDGGASLGEHFNEKDINLDISLKLQTLLINGGAGVVMTRYSDVSLEEKSDLQSSRYKRDLDARRDIVNNSNADIFVSIHSNCFRSNPKTRGAIIFYNYSSEEGKILAESIGSSINEIVYKSLLGSVGLESKVLPEDLFMLRSTNVPGVLIETGYMTNWEEGRLLRQNDFQAAMAEAIAEGLQNYYKSKNALRYYYTDHMFRNKQFTLNSEPVKCFP
jgi:N-acetylmuramoyl-L-alanine amidase